MNQWGRRRCCSNGQTPCRRRVVEMDEAWLEEKSLCSNQEGGIYIYIYIYIYIVPIYIYIYIYRFQRHSLHVGGIARSDKRLYKMVAMRQIVSTRYLHLECKFRS